MYEMATGMLPFQGDTTAAIFNAILNRAATPSLRINPNLPADMDRIISKALEKDPEFRYQSAAEMRSDLKRLKRETDSGRTATAVPVQPWKARRGLIVTGALLTLAVVATIMFWVRPTIQAPRVLSTTQLTTDNLPKDYVVTDGPRIYFTETVGERGLLSQVSAAGGEINRIFTPFTNNFLHDASPARSELLVDSFSGDAGFLSSGAAPLWVVPVPAGSPRRAGNFLANTGVWSRDGQQLAYSEGHDIYLAKWDGIEPHKLMTIPGLCIDLQFSPTGKHLRFTARDPSLFSVSLWEVNIDGSGLRKILPESAHAEPGECCGRWSADGRYYFYVALRTARSDIWALREETSFLRKRNPDPSPITMGPLAYQSPAAALNGNRLFVIGIQPRAELQRFDSKSQLFVPFLNGISGGETDFSRDGHWITYVSYPDYLLWRMRSDGSEKLQLTYAPLSVSMPRWSADGKQIAFVGALPGKSPKVCIVAADGGTTQEIPHDDQHWPDDPQWSPDGKSLTFALYPAGIVGTKPQDFSVSQFDFETRKTAVIPGTEGMLGPRWSPDGHYLATFTADTKKVMLLEFGTGKWSELATGSVLQYANWGPSSKSVYFEDLGPHGPEIDRVSVATSKKETVIALKGISRVALLDSGTPWNGVAPDGAPLIMRDAGSRELYSLELDLP